MAEHKGLDKPGVNGRGDKHHVCYRKIAKPGECFYVDVNRPIVYESTGKKGPAGTCENSGHVRTAQAGFVSKHDTLLAPHRQCTWTQTLLFLIFVCYFL